MSIGHLIVKPATKSQARQVIIRNAGHWGAKVGMSVDDFVKLSQVFQQGPVLVPEDDPDTIDFYASCQILTRQVLTLRTGQSSPELSFGHAVSSVLVLPEYRGKGYAGRFMSLLHSALAPYRYPNPLKVPVATERASTTGWTLQKSFVTTWPVSAIQVPAPKGNFPPVEFLSESEVTATLDSDDSNIAGDLIELQKKDPTKTYFAFTTTSSLNAVSATISKLSPGDFMTWAFFRRPGLTLAITRLRASTDSFPVLLDAALRTAQETKSEYIEIWNVPEHLKEMALATGGETVERPDNRSAFKWYGQPSEAKLDNTDVVWALMKGMAGVEPKNAASAPSVQMDHNLLMQMFTSFSMSMRLANFGVILLKNLLKHFKLIESNQG
ncbi:hypothetical protein RHS01_09871 [Rhizoctonia solani]|uniref:LYC1 C-terminal domain-containing protein n=1 Tax=Rhizoctonia solani TaxID=456999 RepID=A0A8H7I2P2_9AGAM|nr:hypothetical protein RHS01_09871 [Rhizoctonia solani]